MNRFKKSLAEIKNSESGFSLIDVVVTVAIIVALSVGGFIAYTGLVDQAKQAAVDSAASSVYQGALVYENDGNPETDACFAVDEYNESSSGIEVHLLVPSDNPLTPDDVEAYYGEGNTENTYECV